MIAFHLPITPPKATSQGAGKRILVKDGKPMFFKNRKATSAENDLTLLCSRHVPREPMDGPLSLSIDFVFPWRASEPKKRIALGRVPHTSKPDCSNLVKMIEDCLTRLQFWKDDSQVADLRVTKAWGKAVGIYVAIRPLPSEPAPAGSPGKSDPTEPVHG
ncbi:RusA family crossover junction endodeoxyribonuclease [Luteolibacter flavescens]|uniref:RusA family crossover junction endodeoxyribonuclease n=1 Tax=Luteolibacter flavescens TaxID=1859460 RepID=A0ABT3FPV7_9BACT|nr:RusA family crossover junction endodeoxyribonuclease [Luteolibacter flavescens]MCW1885602.1 RusA family crossover junction endodeoxyribonuclease [Luteolibacter flavescens]